MFLIEYVAQLVCFGDTGVFLYQFESCSDVSITGQNSLDKCNRAEPCKETDIDNSLFGGSVCDVRRGNLTEEFCLPFILGCVYCCIKYVKYGNVAPPPKYAFVYGGCFGVILLIRVTNAVTICAIVLVVAIVLMVKNCWRNLYQNAFAFCLGFGLAISLAILWCACNGILDKCWMLCFVFSMTYAAEGGLINWFFLRRHFLQFVFPLIFHQYYRSGLPVRMLSSSVLCG